jgi:hypothetical protein
MLPMQVVLLGLVAAGLTAALTVPPSLSLVSKLRELIEAARQTNPELFGRSLESLNPFAGGSFKHNRVTGILRADFSGFGEPCLRLQLEARRLDRRAHLGMLPVLLFGIGLAVWWLRR